MLDTVRRKTAIDMTRRLRTVALARKNNCLYYYINMSQTRWHVRRREANRREGMNEDGSAGAVVVAAAAAAAAITRYSLLVLVRIDRQCSQRKRKRNRPSF